MQTKGGIKTTASDIRLYCSMTYMGHVISRDGLLSDSAKIEAIQKMPRPTNVAGIRRIIGMTGYLSRFLRHLSNLCEPLRQLQKQSIQWQWNEEHQQAFDKIKAAVAQTPILQYFDGKLPTTIQCHASQTGLGAVLMQSIGPIAYASRALTETEKQYAQIEKEMLTIVYAMRNFIPTPMDATSQWLPYTRNHCNMRQSVCKECLCNYRSSIVNRNSEIS